MLQYLRHEESRIYWGNQGYYDSGTLLTWYGREHVHYENELLPPGEEVHSWYSSSNYQSSRMVTPLPLLLREREYQLTLTMTPFPERSVFTRITFYNRYGEVDSYEVTKTNHLLFTYPKNAYTYTISLISAGMKELDFYHLEIKEVNTSVDEP